jgi:hypothetical protein
VRKRTAAFRCMRCLGRKPGAMLNIRGSGATIGNGKPLFR